MTTLEIAQAYAKLGWSIVPCPPMQKHPVISWKPWQQTRADDAQLQQWFRQDSNLALITGAISGVIVLDVDRGGEENLAGKDVPETPCVRTGSGGMHYYFQHPGFNTGNWVGKLAHIDFRGDGGLVILPPSVHPNGNSYEWIISPFDVPLGQAPLWFLALITPMHEEIRRPQAQPHALTGDGSSYGKAALRHAIRDITIAQISTRNQVLNQVAFKIGQLVAGGELQRTLAEDELSDAGIGAGLTPVEVRATVKSGLDSGATQPKTAPQRPR